MPLNPADRSFLKDLYPKLDVWPLEPGDPLYQPVYGHAGGEDPISLLQNEIEFSGVESVTLFSGFRGSGKTTELFRLKKSLEESDYVVLYADALNYLNPNLPVDIAEILVVLAGAFSDALLERQIDLKSEGYWTRLWNWLSKTEVTVKELGMKAEAGVDPVKAGGDLKLEFRTTPSFRQKLTAALSGRVGELNREVRIFFEEGFKALKRECGENTQVVFLFDSLEQLRGSISNEAEVVRSVENLFSNHEKLLKIPYLHVVYTVPPWLKFVLPGARVVVLPCVRLWLNDNARSTCDPGFNAFRGVLRKRFTERGLERFFGPDPFSRADRLILLSGGHFRDLLLLVREALLRADSLPVSEHSLEAAILRVRSNFLPIAITEALWLKQIEQERATLLKERTPEEIGLLTRFLDSHIVLYLRNGQEWYDIHPLIREEVWAITRAAEKLSKLPNA
jgi:hypothetical protein